MSLELRILIQTIIEHIAIYTHIEHLWKYG